MANTPASTMQALASHNSSSSVLLFSNNNNALFTPPWPFVLMIVSFHLIKTTGVKVLKANKPANS